MRCQLLAKLMVLTLDCVNFWLLLQHPQSPESVGCAITTGNEPHRSSAPLISFYKPQKAAIRECNRRCCCNASAAAAALFSMHFNKMKSNRKYLLSFLFFSGSEIHPAGLNNNVDNYFPHLIKERLLVPFKWSWNAIGSFFMIMIEKEKDDEKKKVLDAAINVSSLEVLAAVSAPSHLGRKKRVFSPLNYCFSFPDG